MWDSNREIRMKRTHCSYSILGSKHPHPFSCCSSCCSNLKLNRKESSFPSTLILWLRLLSVRLPVSLYGFIIMNSLKLMYSININRVMNGLGSKLDLQPLTTEKHFANCVSHGNRHPSLHLTKIEFTSSPSLPLCQVNWQNAYVEGVWGHDYSP